MRRNIETKDVIRTVYKGAVISGSTMIANDAAQYLQFGTYGKSITPFGKILRNVASTALGYGLGKKVADMSWNAIEAAVARFNEED